MATLTLVDAKNNTWIMDVVVDTGFSEFLTLPESVLRELSAEHVGTGLVELADGSLIATDQYIVTVKWLGVRRRVLADVGEGDPLLGMLMLRDCRLSIDIQPGGQVIIQPLA